MNDIILQALYELEKTDVGQAIAKEAKKRYLDLLAERRAYRTTLIKTQTFILKLIGGLDKVLKED